MLDTPFFSIITPAYNGMRYLQAAIDSVLWQDFEDYEHIIVDDCSTDGTAQFVAALADGGNGGHVVTVMLDSNGGIGNARNVGIGAARGEYLLFLDQDDFFETGALRRLKAELESKGSPDVLCFGMNRVDEEGVLIRSFPPELSGKALRWDLCTVWTYALRRSVVVDNSIEFPVDSMNEDLIFSLQVARFAASIESMGACLYDYRINEQSTSRSMSPRFDRYPDSRTLVFRRCREAYDSVGDEEDRKLIFLTALAYFYSIQFGIFRHDDRQTRLREYRLHRAELERWFGNYLHGHSVTLFRPKCRRFIYRLVVWVSYRMEKYLGQGFFEWFMLRF